MLTWLPIAVCPNNIGILWKVVSQEGYDRFGFLFHHSNGWSHWIGSPHGVQVTHWFSSALSLGNLKTPSFGKWKGLIFAHNCLLSDPALLRQLFQRHPDIIESLYTLDLPATRYASGKWSFTEIFSSENVMSSWWWLASCVRGRSNVYSWFISKQALHVWYSWWFRNPANQLRLVVYPIIFWLLYIPGAHSEPQNNRHLWSPKRRWTTLPRVTATALGQSGELPVSSGNMLKNHTDPNRSLCVLPSLKLA